MKSKKPYTKVTMDKSPTNKALEKRIEAMSDWIKELETKIKKINNRFSSH